MTWPERGLVMLVAFFGLVALRFSFVQSIWTDETTQLSGLTLGMADMVMWLANAYPHEFNVPPDRQPPLSYIVMKGLTLLGAGELVLRWLGIAAVGSAAVIVYRTGRLLFAPGYALFAACFFLLRPEVVVFSNQIRPYPLFSVIAATALYFTIRAALADDHGTRVKSWAFALLAAVLAVYDHFYGLMVLGTVGLTALALIVFTKESIQSILKLLVIAVLATLPVLPFVIAAMGVGSSGDALPSESVSSITDAVKDIVRFGYWSIGGGPLIAANLVALGLAMLGTAALLAVFAIGFIPLLKESLRGNRRSRVVVCAFFSMIVGVGILLLARLLNVSNFEVLSPNYNSWLWPIVAVVFGLAASQGQRRFVVPAVITLVAARSVSMLVLLIHAEHFTHSAGDQMNKLASDQSAEAIFYEADAAWASPYFSTTFRKGDDFPQFLVSIDEEGRLTYQRIQDGGALIDVAEPLMTRVIVARYVNMGQGELRKSLRSPGAALGQGLVAEKLLLEGGTLQTSLIYPSFIGARLEVIDRSNKGHPQ
ncbi:MAG: glycosyltransferase family 39 protein [Pseudomonadota bacterium]